MLRTSLVLWLVFLASQCFAQGYIIVGDSLKQGKVQRLSEGRINFQETIQGEGKVYYPEQISEYKTKWDLYKAFEINGQHRLYKRIATGDVSLYRYDKIFLLIRNDQLIDFRKKDLREVLNKELNLEAGKNELSRLGSTDASLKTAVDAVNQHKFDIKNVAYKKFGIFYEYNRAHVTSSPQALKPLSGTASVAALGIFTDLPFNILRPWIYLNAEINVLKYSPRLYESFQGNTESQTLSIQTLNTLAGIKIIRPTGNFRPYATAGFMVSYQRIRPASNFVVTTNNLSHIPPINILTEPASGIQVGLKVGAGLQIQLSRRQNIHLEARYTNSFNEITDGYKIATSNAGFLVGFSL